MFYTYILQSLPHPTRRYIGHTGDLKQRLAEHNAGKCLYTTEFKPWKVSLYLAFETDQQADHFERYLKTGSGHAFAQRHFWAAASTSHPTTTSPSNPNHPSSSAHHHHPFRVPTKEPRDQ